jgi:hypothetical protein
MGVDWLSFPADDVNPVTFKEITDWVTGPQFVMEVSEGTPLNNIEQYPVEFLEITSSQLNLIDLLPTRSWFVSISLSDWKSVKSELEKYKGKISFLLVELDGLNLQLIDEMATTFKVLINYSQTQSVAELLLLPIEGINISGERELKPGLKDFDKLSSILEELEVAD